MSARRRGLLGSAARAPLSRRTNAAGCDGGRNDLTAREGMWRRLDGDEWAAFDALPPLVRQRLHEHAYDAWAVNALALWRSYRRKHLCSERAIATLLYYLKECEDLERAAFAAGHRRSYGTELPHIAAGVSVLRYGTASTEVSAEAVS